MAKPWHRWPKGLRPYILNRDGHRCTYPHPHKCKPTHLVLDHIIRPEDGGAWFDPTNLRTICITANNQRANQPTNRTPSRGW